jgi:type I restriction enzyme S subunit
VRFDPASVNSRFAAYVLASRAVQRLFKASMDVGAKAGMSLITVRKIRMPLPPVPEQDAIAAALSDVDGLIASLDRLIAKKRAIKQAAMQQLLTGKTRLPGFKGKWDAKPLRALADITMGQSPSSSFYNLRGDGLPLIQGNADIEDRRSIARVWTTQASKRCIAGDILLTVRAPVGAVGVASESACLGRGVCGLRPLADSSFLLQALVCAEPRWKILEQGSTFTSANRTQVGQFELRVPLDPSEQHAIAVVLDDMDADLRSLEVRAAKAKAIKQGMMQALLTGRVRLPVTAAAGGQA